MSEKVVESRRKGRYNTWALDFIKNHSRAIRRLYRVYNVDPPLRKQDRIVSILCYSNAKASETK